MTDTQRGWHQRVVRDDIVRLLQRGMVRDLDDARCRFVPRKALVEIIKREQVERLLDATCTSAHNLGNQEPLAAVARRIVPSESEDCSCCKSVDCTGGRFIFATLLLIGKEEVVSDFFPEGTWICDQILPFRIPMPNTASSLEPQPDSAIRELPGLDASDKELFSHYQWQVISQHITKLSPAEIKNHWFRCWDREISLPWKELKRLREPVEAELSTVQKAKIFEGSHNLVSPKSRGPHAPFPCRRLPQLIQKTTKGGHKDSIFAVKTFKKWQTPGLTGDRFEKELQGNLRAPSNDRIIPLLSAFQHRESFILIFPWAHGGSVTEFWERYSEGSSGNSADRFSEKWLLDECIGIADAVAAIHGLKGDSSTGFVAQMHADIKPENILCFDVSELPDSPVILKIADFGEANVVGWGRDSRGRVIQGAKGMHVATYRPPENNSKELVSLKYDVWCLGCFYLDFITWFLLGLTGLGEFDDNRLEEQDDPEVLEARGDLVEDIYFKQTKGASWFRCFRSLGVKFKSSKTMVAGRPGTAYSLSVTASVRTDCKLKDNVIRVSLLIS